MLSQEVQRATSHVVTAAMKGAAEASQSSGSSSGDLLEKLIAAFSSDKGSSLLTLAISVACRSSTSAWCEHQARQDAAALEAGRPDNLQRLLNWAGVSLLYHGCMQQICWGLYALPLSVSGLEGGLCAYHCAVLC